MHCRLQLALALSTAALCQVALADLVRIPLASLERATTAGARLVESYPQFALVELDAAGRTRLQQEGVELAPELHGYRLALPYMAAIDPQQRQPWDRSDAATLPEGPLLIQFRGPTRPEWIATLATHGVEVVQYLHPYTYIVLNQRGNIAPAIAALPAIRWAGELPLQARIAPTLNTRSELTADVRVLRSARVAADVDGLRAIDATLTGEKTLDTQLVEQRVRVAGASLEALARLDGVLSVQSIPSDGGLRGEIGSQQLAGNVGADNLPLPNYPDWLAGRGVSGAGVRMANVDGGVQNTHPDLVNRFVPCTGITCGGAAVDTHGTHTAAIMAGDGSSGVRNAAGFLRGLGVAPGAQLIEQVYNPHYLQAGGMLLLMRESAQNRAVLSSNSWGPAGSPRGYDADTRQVDVGTRDTDPTVDGDQPLIFVLSIMNGNGGTSSQGTPDEAKNVITVGSTNSQASSGAALTTWRDISANSGHGPALDGRRIPHLVAPGCRVDSATTATGYGLLCGTSMATPHVSGALALFLQKYRIQFGERPSPALAKAALIAATIDLNGRTDADGITLGHRPDSKQGWGQLHLGLLLDQVTDSYIVDQGVVLTSTGSSWQTQLQAVDPSRPVKVILTYTDAPGHGLCSSGTCTTPAWNNDLDLTVQTASTLFRGNVFDSEGRSQAGGIADEKNNLEAVLFEAGRVQQGLTVTVSASNLSADALPNSVGALQQDFALLCSNCKPFEETDRVFANGLE